MTKDEFLAILAPQAIQARLDGSPLFPSVRLAQNALETGWKINKHNNLGGFKAGSGQPNEWWRGETYTTTTWEVINGQRIQTVATWRSYASVYDFYRDQDRLFQSARYSRVCAAQTPEQQAEALQACGYATDPDYASKLKAIIKTYSLTRYDKEADKMLQQLQTTINEQRDKIAALERKVQKLEAQQSMPVPEWAREPVEVAMQKGLVANPDGGSYDFYRFVTVLHRAGVI